MSKTDKDSNLVKTAYLILTVAGVCASVLKYFNGNLKEAVYALGIMLIGILLTGILSAILELDDLKIVAKILLYSGTLFVLLSMFTLVTGIPKSFYCGFLSKFIELPNCSGITSTKNEILFENNLIAYLPMNGNANALNDNRLQGVIVGPKLTEDRKNISNSAYEFDGKDDFIEIKSIGGNSKLANIQDFSLSMWVYFDGFLQKNKAKTHIDRQYIFSGGSYSKTIKKDFVVDGISVFFDKLIEGDEEYVAVTRHPMISPTHSTISSILPNKKKWNFLSFIREGDSLLLYINDRQVSENKCNPQKLNMDHNFFIGTFSGNNPNYAPIENYK